jgi:hypothetical protein
MQLSQISRSHKSNIISNSSQEPNNESSPLVLLQACGPVFLSKFYLNMFCRRTNHQTLWSLLILNKYVHREAHMGRGRGAVLHLYGGLRGPLPVASTLPGTIKTCCTVIYSSLLHSTSIILVVQRWSTCGPICRTAVFFGCRMCLHTWSRPVRSKASCTHTGVTIVLGIQSLNIVFGQVSSRVWLPRFSSKTAFLAPFRASKMTQRGNG